MTPLRVLHAPAEIAGQASVLARALRGLGVEDATDRAALGESGRAYAEREHAAPVVAARLLGLYRSLAPEGSPA